MRKKSSLLSRISFLLVLVMVISLVTPATAATVSAASVKAATNYKKAPSVRLKKAYTVTLKRTKNSPGQYVKFKAPANGTYKFTVKNIHSKGRKTSNEIGCGTFYIKGLNNKYGYLSNLKAKTQYGKTASFSVCTSKFKRYDSHAKKVTAYLTSRYAKLKLKKNQVVYFYMHYAGDKNIFSCDLKITK